MINIFEEELIVTAGTLKKRDFYVSGQKRGKVRQIINDKGININQALQAFVKFSYKTLRPLK